MTPTPMLGCPPALPREGAIPVHRCRCAREKEMQREREEGAGTQTEREPQMSGLDLLFCKRDLFSPCSDY